MTLEIEFVECEHIADLDKFRTDLKNSGAEILDSSMHQDESALIYIRMKNNNDFMKRFRKTASYEFANVY